MAINKLVAVYILSHTLSEQKKETCGVKFVRTMISPIGSNRKRIMPLYSAEIESSWEVVRQMRLQGYVFSFVAGSSFTAKFFDTSGAYSHKCDVAPLAICVAALKAKGVNVPFEN